MANKSNFSDGKSPERRREMKRTIDADRVSAGLLWARARQHAAKVNGPLPAAYAKGSNVYAAAYRGRPVSAQEIEEMRSALRKPAEPENAQV